MSRVQIFVSYDPDHDQDLYERLVSQSRAVGSKFDVLGASEPGDPTAETSETVRGFIRDADQAIFLCGAHTGDSHRMGAELQLVQEEDTPYILLWGRRETMCTKPLGAKSSEGMYSWTRDILSDQISTTDRRARSDAAVRTSIAAKHAPASALAGGSRSGSTEAQRGSAATKL